MGRWCERAFGKTYRGASGLAGIPRFVNVPKLAQTF